MTREEAINEVKKAMPTICKETKEALNVLISELAESEDERVIEEIKEFIFKRADRGDLIAKRKKWIAYLEKQKEQTEELSTRLNGLMQEYVKSGKDEEEQEHRLKCYQLFWDALGDSEFFEQKEQDKCPEYCVRSHCIGCPIYEKQKEQKHAEWSEKDKDYYDAIIAKLEVTQDDAMLTDNQMDFLKSLPERLNLQPKREWSEEDKEMVETICKEGDLKPSEQRWLKSLRPQPKQEWSDEDEDFINMLILHFNYLINKGGDSVETYKSYIEGLKSIRPQPKQEWSEKDKEMLIKVEQIVLKYWNSLSDSFYHKYDAENQDAESCYNWLKSLPLNLKKNN